ncbi:hypothetical protein DENSPDRAFT_833100 [Dentipellis sp. KUC8613]|nr:hypothetical protein DENSPDRAFT_833100 [Dentipellis sp. KUC8613]
MVAYRRAGTPYARPHNNLPPFLLAPLSFSGLFQEHSYGILLILASSEPGTVRARTIRRNHVRKISGNPIRGNRTELFSIHIVNR